VTDLPTGTVTFLFTDIEGSTRLLKELGAETYGDVLSTHNRLLREAFEHAGGRETNHQGDSFVAVFASAGAAVRAAVEAQRSLASAAWPDGAGVRVRMGLHTGEATLEQDGYVGFAVHAAARIGDIGYGGQVLLSATASRLVEHDLPRGVVLRELGPTPIPELDDSEVLYQLEIEGLPQSFPPLAPRQEPPTRPREPLLEREAELAVLRAVVESGPTGRGQLVVVEGAAGIGKTRLLAAAREAAESGGMRLLSARGGEFEVEFSYGVVRQLFEPALTTASSEERAELLAGAAELAAPLFDLSRPDAVMGDDVSFATLHGLYWLTANLAAQSPLALVIDDLHWCDAPSLRFLAYLVKRMEGLPVLVAAGIRSSEPGVDEVVMSEIAGDPLALVVRPSELSPEAAARFLAQRLGRRPDEEFAAACYAAVGGNPLLLRELASRIASEGLTPTAANAGEIEELGPRAVSRAVLLRLARLPHEATRLARAAAILGDQAELPLAAELAELEVAAARPAGSALVRADVLSQSDPVCFAHPVVRAAVHADILPGERSQLHRRAAALVIESGGIAEQAAAHLLATMPGSDPFVLDQLRLAASRSLARGAADAAVAYLRRALEEAPPGADRGDVLRELGLAERLVDTAAAVEHLGQAVDAIDDPVRRADTALAYGRMLLRENRHDDAVQVLGRARDELGDRDQELGQCLAAELIGAASFDPHLLPIARRELESVREAELHGGVGSELLLSTLAYYGARRGDERERTIALARRALASGSLHREGARAFFYSTYALTIAGELEEAVRVYDEAVDEARRRGDLTTVSALLVFRGIATLHRGDLRSAEDDLRESLEIAGVTTARPYQTGFLAEVLIERGELEEAELVHRRAGLPDELPPSGHLAFYLDTRARLRFVNGRHEDAVRDLMTLGRRLEALETRNPAFLPWRAHAAEALLAVGRHDEARALAREELELARRWGTPRAIGIALRALALAEGGDDGVSALREAVELLDGSPARLEYARALVDLGAALRRADGRGEAREHLRRGLELAELSGGGRLAEQARIELIAAGVRPRPVILSGVESLTASERRVAEMAGEGMTNREIAQALFVTPKTVEVHLSSVYRKLGIASRAQLAESLAADASVPAAT
jgi:class 3 adenylate cyclase/DNA-binding CsgD family transcriptional regulator/tetratricopeptide (TPR) repeat protein